MHSGRKRAFVPFLYLIYTLIIGMCLGTIPADSDLGYADSSSCYAESAPRTCSIRSGHRVFPSGLVFEPRGYGQCEAALSLRQTTRRQTGRTGRNLPSVSVITALFFLTIPYFTSARSPGFPREVFSITVIIDYIHRQDGQKASPLFSSSFQKNI